MVFPPFSWREYLIYSLQRIIKPNWLLNVIYVVSLIQREPQHVERCGVMDISSSLRKIGLHIQRLIDIKNKDKNASSSHWRMLAYLLQVFGSGSPLVFIG